MVQMNVSEAKAKLSELLVAAEAGDEVVIARAGKPVVRLVAVTEPPKRKLGFLHVEVDDALFEPLAPDELAEWE
jgi:prevent-host-death family protein